MLDATNEIAWPTVFLVERDRIVSWRFVADDYRNRPPVDEVLRAIDDAAERAR